METIAVLESFSDRDDCLTHRYSCPDLTFTKEIFTQGGSNGLKSIILLRSKSIDIEYHDGAHQDSCTLIQKQVWFNSPQCGLQTCIYSYNLHRMDSATMY